jgi:hypothetical protein
MLLTRPGLAGETNRHDGTKGQEGAARVVAAGRHYKAGSLHRLFFGEGYRSLWQAAIEVDVLDLDTFAGGLQARKKGGGKQTHSLTFESRDGREWKFRSIDKDPSAVLPEDLRETFVDALVQDQISAAHPLGPLMVDPLADSLGILSAKHRLVLLPDSERLGVFRKEFGGTLGFIEEKIRAEDPVTPGFEGFHKLLDTVELWKRLGEHPEEKVDAKALLRARLFDIFINDFDRHKDQWRWARRRGTQLWQPVPEDRDQAFVSYSGLVMSLVRFSQPRLVDFRANYPGIFGLTWQGRFIDRRHLSELEWKDWEEAIRFIQSHITDAIIDDAVERLPEEYRQITSGRTAAALKGRLRQLPKVARRFYEQLAQDVEIHGSDKAEMVTIRPPGDGPIQVSMTDMDGKPIFVRSFDPEETRSIRLYLYGGDDRVVREAGTRGVTIRVIGGKGEDTLDDSKAGGTRFYDEGVKSRVISGAGTSVHTGKYETPLDSAGNPNRDWGRQRFFRPWLSAGGDLGVFLGGAMRFTTYSFRHHPYAQTHVLGAGYATGFQGYRAQYNGEFMRESGTAGFQIHARASELDLIRFYGLGNETKAEGPESYFELRQKQFSLSPQYRVSLGPLDLSVGALMQYTKEPDRPSLAAATRPYGFGGFGKIGPRLDVEIGPARAAAKRASSGRLQFGGSFFPKAWSVTHSFGEIHGEASAFLKAPLPLRPTLALRAGGKQVFGRYPYQEAAFLGGADTLRGLRPQRYAGDSSASASAELRLRLGRVRLVLPSDIGVFGLADVGRVFYAGETSDRWHHGVGGGIWLAVLKPENTITLALARSEGVSRLYLRAGVGF